MAKHMITWGNKKGSRTHTHTHTHSCTSIFARTFSDMVHALALYPNLSFHNWVPNPKLYPSLTLILIWTLKPSCYPQTGLWRTKDSPKSPNFPKSPHSVPKMFRSTTTKYKYTYTHVSTDRSPSYANIYLNPSSQKYFVFSNILGPAELAFTPTHTPK